MVYWLRNGPSFFGGNQTLILFPCCLSISRKRVFLLSKLEKDLLHCYNSSVSLVFGTRSSPKQIQSEAHVPSKQTPGRHFKTFVTYLLRLTSKFDLVAAWRWPPICIKEFSLWCRERDFVSKILVAKNQKNSAGNCTYSWSWSSHSKRSYGSIGKSFRYVCDIEIIIRIWIVWHIKYVLWFMCYS